VRLAVFLFAVMLAATFSGSAALAAHPEPWGLGLQAAASPVMEDIQAFHDNLLLPIISVITVFVSGLMVYVMIRFNKRANPTPSSFTHNTTVEVIWTVVPVLILVVIAIPSFKLLYKADRIPDAEMTLKVTGNQWYWSYAYPDQGDFSFDSNLVEDGDLPADGLRQLSVDNKVVLPVDTNVRVLVTGADVLHNWAVPAFGMKIDTVPGRLSESWVRITQEGTYYGQCSELCGVRHAYMPIEVEAVSKEKFEAWVKQAQAKYGTPDGAATKMARAAR
jgi:cytochrome c oxidase subunit II